VREESVEIALTVAPTVDIAGFEAFYRRERPGLLTLARALCRSSQPAVIEDIVQDAFVRACERWPQIAQYDGQRTVAVGVTNADGKGWSVYYALSRGHGTMNSGRRSASTRHAPSSASAVWRRTRHP
jgi:hypothetical protein